MLNHLKQFKTWLVTCCCVFLLSGCSFSFVYNHLDWWANWYLDDYVILDDSQQAEFDKAFSALHLWHRKTQLKVYYTQLDQLKQQVNEGISLEQAQAQIAQMQSHWFALREKAKPDLISLTYLLKPEQRTELIEAFEENNKEIVAEREILTREQWVKEECINQQKQFRKWVGKLTKAQKQTICDMTEPFQTTFDYWIEYRTNWLTQFENALSPEQTKEVYETLFAELISEPEKLRDPEFTRLREQNNQAFAEIFVYMMNNLSKKQRNRFNNRIDDLIDDLMDLEKDS